MRSALSGIHRLLHGFDPIPQSEIDEAVRQIMVEHGTGPEAVAYAAGVVERLQWSKNYREQVKADRVLKALRNMRV